MIDATFESSTSTPDPSMERLAPRPSRVRNLLLVLAGIAVLLAAWFSPVVLRASLSPRDGSQAGSWSALPSHRQVLTTSLLTAQTWPRVDVRSVDDVPGAHVAGAWIVDASVSGAFDDSVDESDYESGRSYIEASMPGFDAERDALPTSLDHGHSAFLIVLWDIDSCDELEAGQTSPATADARTVLRTSRAVDLPDFAGPGFDIDALRGSGICP